MKFEVGFVCDRGLNPRRPVNQDRLLTLPDCGVFAVFDGVGGQQAGDVASQTASDTIKEALTQPSIAPTSESVRRAIQFANRDIFELAESDAALRTMATTVALIHINGERATVAHVGDSRVYRLADGRFHRETVDHADQDDSALSRTSRNGRAAQNVINRALGVEPEVEVEVKSVPVGEGTRFLLCSDGVYKHLSDDEIARVLANNQNPQNVADEFKRIVYERGADDNLTAVVVQVGRKPGRKPLLVDERKMQPGVGADGSTRIEVEFGAKGGSASEEPNPRPARRLIYALVLLVLLATAFYAGLRASGLAHKPAPGATSESTVSESLRTGLQEFHEGRYREAAESFASAATREPTDPSAWYWLGRAQLEIGDYQKAAENLDRAGVKIPEANLYGAAAYRAIGNRAKAEALLDRYNDAIHGRTLTRDERTGEGR